VNVVVIGGGHNGLATAFYLAKAGLKPIVLEAGKECGGGAATLEIHPGFRCPALSHHTPLWRHVVSDMALGRHGLQVLHPATETFSPGMDSAPLVVPTDRRQAADAIRRISAADAAAYASYRTAMEGIAGVLGTLLTTAPPDIDRPTAGDAWALLKAGRRYRALDRRDRFRLLRWAPMAVSDLTSEWFESDLLCAATAGPALSGTSLGPRSAGSGLVLLLHEATRTMAGGVWRPRGGPGALARAMAASARAAGADIRTATRVEQIVITDERAAAVIADGERIDAAAVVSAVDPKTTFLDLIDPADLAPEFLRKIRNYRASGTLGKVNLALSALPPFGAAPDELSGRIQIGPAIDYLERAFDHVKYGEMSQDPWLDVTIPSILDADLAPAGAHVMSIYVHYAPYQLRHGDWASERETLLANALRVLERFAPGIRSMLVAAHVLTPTDLESAYGFHRGHIHHGELAMDQIATMRPLLGYARYGSPVAGLYLCSGGTHPGGFMTGVSGKLAAREIIGALS
jgi:phytoene dehydrogenase-like protein